MVMNAADNEPSAALYYIITLKSSLVKVGRCRIHGMRLDNLSAICYTCREKQKLDVCGMAVNVRLKIKATVTDLELAAKYMHAVRDGFFTADDGKKHSQSEIGSVCSDIIEYTAWGEYTESDGMCVIRYKESPDIGVDNCRTALIFSPEDRNSLIMNRDGDISTACRFDMKEKRQYCRYETPVMPVEFTVNTRKVHNTVNRDGGAILLDYNIEVRGINIERNRLFIEVMRYDGK